MYTAFVAACAAYDCWNLSFLHYIAFSVFCEVVYLFIIIIIIINIIIKNVYYYGGAIM